MPKISKKFALLLVLAMLASMFVGMGTVSALGTYSTLNGAPSVEKNTTATLGTITGIVDAGAVTASTVLSVKLPKNFVFPDASVTTQDDTPAGAGLEFFYPETMQGEANAFYGVDFTIEKLADNEITIKPDTTPAAGEKGYFYLYLRGIEVPSGASGDVTATLSSNSGWGSGSIVVAKVNDGLVTIECDETKALTSDSDAVEVTLRFKENMRGALNAGDQAISLKLPAGFSWNDASDLAITPVWGSGIVATASQRATDERYLDLNVTTGSDADGGAKECFTITAEIAVEDSSTAKFGDIKAILSTKHDNELTNTEPLLVGTYGDYGFTATAASTPDVYAGQLEQEIGDFTIAESAPGSLIADRTFTLTLSDNAKWAVIDADPSAEEVTVDMNKVVGDDGRTLKYTVGDESVDEAGSVTFEDQEIVVSPHATGDVTVTIDGSGIDQTVVVAKAVAPLVVTCASQDVQLGVQDQAASDIVIKEAAAEMLKDNYDLVITLPDGIHWAQTPTATVTDGDLLIDATNMDIDDEVLTIPIDGDSSTASTITLTNVKYSVDRTYPEGKASAKFGGDAIVAVNCQDRVVDAMGDLVSEDGEAPWYVTIYDDGLDYRFFTADDVGIWPALDDVLEQQVANCVTPAPTDKTAVATFVIGQAKYTVNGVEVTMDVAPYIKDSRTFMPIRYVANALGITDANILWDADLQTVTLMKGDKVVQLKIGSNVMLVNGAAVSMDVAPEINNSRTCLPIALVANAFGATASWDAATQTVTIK